MSAAWEKYANDFNAMTDEDWLEAVAAWEAAGKPRKVSA